MMKSDRGRKQFANARPSIRRSRDPFSKSISSTCESRLNARSPIISLSRGIWAIDAAPANQTFTIKTRNE
jgi:hypothetical protein